MFVHNNCIIYYNLIGGYFFIKMSELTIFTRIQNKHDSQQNWDSSTFIPQQGELIVYDSDNSQSAPKIKVGDGVRTASELPFTTSIFIQSAQPTNASVYSIWIDTSANVLKFKNSEGNWETTSLEESLKQALNQDAVVLSESEKYTDNEIIKLSKNIYTKEEVDSTIETKMSEALTWGTF